MQRAEISGCSVAQGVSISVSGDRAFRAGDMQSGLAGIGRFNHPELKLPIGSSPDQKADALLSIWRRDGAEALSRVSGSYMLIFWESSRQQIVITTDKFSTHPIFWSARDKNLAFASNPTKVPALLGETASISSHAVLAYTYFHCIPAPLSICEDVARLDRGNLLDWKSGVASVRPSWRPVFKEAQTFSFQEQKQAFFSALSDGIKEGIADTEASRIGSFLSGGTDSSTLAGLIGNVTGESARTFSIVFDEPRYDEREYSRIASRHFNTTHTEHVLTADQVKPVIERISENFVQPFGNSSAIPTFVCADVAASHGVERLFAGDGGDELYGGNTRYATAWLLGIYDKLPASVRTGMLEPAADLEVASANLYPIRKLKGYIDQARVPMPDRLQGRYNLLNRFGRNTVFSGQFSSVVESFEPANLERSVWDESEGDVLINRLLAYDFKFTLADNDLVKVTTMCEAAGVDVCFPMLSDSVLNHSLQLPSSQKLRGMQLRYFFRNSLREFLPKEIVDKSKHGFGMPFGEWLLTKPDLAAMSDDALASLQARQLVSSSFVQELRAKIRSGDAGYYGTFIWILMMLELWLRQSEFADTRW